MPTPHNSALNGEIAKLVLMPGDPLRAKAIAEMYLDNVVQFNAVRNMFGYTGTYKGHPVSVMGSGMGMPSIGIYSYELFKFYGVETIVRIGSCGSYIAEAKLYDVILADSAFSHSTYAKCAFNYDENILLPSEDVNNQLRAIAKDLGVPLIEGCLHSSDVFYHGPEGVKWTDLVKEYKVVAAEMESFALFANAKYLGKKAACLVTVSDSIVTHEETTAEERQNAFTKMMEVALGLAGK
jgi:purine-nucleoside phosphorylase